MVPETVEGRLPLQIEPLAHLSREREDLHIGLFFFWKLSKIFSAAEGNHAMSSPPGGTKNGAFPARLKTVSAVAAVAAAAVVALAYLLLSSKRDFQNSVFPGPRAAMAKRTVSNTPIQETYVVMIDVNGNVSTVSYGEFIKPITSLTDRLVELENKGRTAASSIEVLETRVKNLE